MFIHDAKYKLKYQYVFFMLIGFLLPVSITVTLLFWRTTRDVIRNNEKLISKVGEQISGSLDSMTDSMYSMSDYFFNDSRVLNYMLQDKELPPELKLVYTQNLKDIFDSNYSYDIRPTVAAVYTKNGTLFNILAPGNDGEEVTGRLEELQVDIVTKYAIMNWYPLMDNFFLKRLSPYVRESKMVMASRRTYHRSTGVYLGTHIFAFREKELFERYSSYLSEEGQRILILNSDGALLSSSYQPYLEGVSVEAEIGQKLENQDGETFYLRLNGEDYLTCIEKSDITGFYTVVLMPENSITKNLNELFQNIIMAFTFFVLLMIVVGVVFTLKFVKPIHNMIQSMHKVENGEFIPAPHSSTKNEIGLMTHYYNRMVERLEQLIEDKYVKEQKSRNLEFKVLMGQINPHFMSNTLESIVWKANSAGLPDVSLLASKLGKLLRLSINDEDITITVRQEIEQLMLYADIQKMRYKDRFLLELKVFGEEIYYFKTLKLILQPVVENAVVHGMKADNSVLIITIHIFTEQNNLIFEIGDNGFGMTDERFKEVQRYLIGQAKLETAGNGIGLKNIHERLILYFGSSYGVGIERRNEGGALIRIVMPLQTVERISPPFF